MDKWLGRVHSFVDKVKKTVESEEFQKRIKDTVEDVKDVVQEVTGSPHPPKAPPEKTVIKTFKIPPLPEKKKRFLIDCLKHKNPSFRAKGAKYLSKKEYLTPEVLNILSLSIKDKEPFVRYSIAATLGNLCNEENVFNALKKGTVREDKIEKITYLLNSLRKDEKLFIRRMADEALRKICHNKTIEDINKKTLERFPLSLQKLLTEEDEKFTEEFKKILTDKTKESLLEALYELDNTIARKTLLEVLYEINFANCWKYVKSIYKRAEYREDAELFGLLAYKIETEKKGPAKYVYEKVPGRRFGRYKRVSKFGRNTKFYMMKRCWRYLKNIAKNKPDLYANFAYFFLKNFKDRDGREPLEIIKHRYDWPAKKYITIIKNYDRFTGLWTFNNVIYGNSKRYVKRGAGWKCAENYRPPGETPEEREELFPELWEKDSIHAFNLLLESECEEINSFAIKILRDRFPEVFQDLMTTEDIKNLLKRPYPFVRNIILEILDKNFNREKPDLKLIAFLFESNFPSVRDLAKKWTGQIIYTIDEKKKFFTSIFETPYHDNWDFAMRLISDIYQKDASLKNEYFKYFTSILLKQKEGEELFKIVINTLKEDFSDELRLLSAEEIFNILNSPYKDVQDLGGWLLLEGQINASLLESRVIMGFANHDLLSVRNAAKKMVNETKIRWKDEIFHIISLLESDWEDTKKFAFEFLNKNFSKEEITIDIVMDLCDSNDTTAQNFGKERLEDYIKEGTEVDFMRLTEHPQINISEFALDLLIEKMPVTTERIKAAMPFFRTVLFQVNRGRKMKNKLLLFLKDAGMKDAFTGAEVINLLKDYTDNVTSKDFSECLFIMTGIKSRYPYIKCPLEIMD